MFTIGKAYVIIWDWSLSPEIRPITQVWNEVRSRLSFYLKLTPCHIIWTDSCSFWLFLNINQSLLCHLNYSQQPLLQQPLPTFKKQDFQLWFILIGLVLCLYRCVCAFVDPGDLIVTVRPLDCELWRGGHLHVAFYRGLHLCVSVNAHSLH